MEITERSTTTCGRYTPEHDKGTGMAFALVSLLFWLFLKQDEFIAAAIVFLICAMTASIILRPLTFLWFGFAELMGGVMSRVILCLVYALLVVPVGSIQKLIGRDELRLRDFKKGRTSVFNVLEHSIETRDIENPY